MRIFFFILVIYLFSLQSMEAQSCQSDAYSESLNYAINLHNQGKTVSSEKALDSLLLNLKTSGLVDCKVYFEAIIEQAFNLIADTKLIEGKQLLLNIISNPKAEPFQDVIATSYIGIALVYEWSQDMESCYSNLEKAKKLILENNLTKTQAFYYVRLSSYNRITGNSQLALENAKTALKYADKNNDIRNRGDALMLIASLSTNPTENEYYTDQTLKHYKQIGNHLNVALRYSNPKLPKNEITSEIHKNNLDSAWHYISLIDEKTTEFYLYGSLIAQKIQKFNKEIGNIDEAYKFALIQLDFNQKYKLLEARNQIEESELKIDLIEQKNKFDQIKRQQRNLIIAITATLITLLGISWLLLYILRTRNKIKKQNLEIIKTNKTLKAVSDNNAMLLTEIHHRVKNNLQNIINLSSGYNQLYISKIYITNNDIYYDKIGNNCILMV